ncbi:hypothetical protein DI09_54p170 [Mitosporidium daphniae]|uniref:Uncharacterized protein n=1 Tax=Mitosporidium daphniae TaxID=1485682 RepID=A0A098VPE0_9MICR|nr:uncharacterized protein DI09_54p170 [Mitosporidium daphniae]KGG50825.1 hypothetical protein DI09_54p170 [Mitosporidium daphniae]|eukprot:XP_013237252.1 uncharacterized protein DI09_54p170 [Mitosporidium daphniae]
MSSSPAGVRARDIDPFSPDSSMLFLNPSSMLSQIAEISSEIRSELAEAGSLFNDFFIQKRQSLSSELSSYSQILSENSGSIEQFKEQFRICSAQKKKIHKGILSCHLRLELENEQSEVSIAIQSIDELTEQKNKISQHLSEIHKKIDEVSIKLKKERECS